MKIAKYFLPSFAAALAIFAFSACEQKGPAEEAGEAVDDAAEEVGDAVEDATD